MALALAREEYRYCNGILRSRFGAGLHVRGWRRGDRAWLEIGDRGNDGSLRDLKRAIE